MWWTETVTSPPRDEGLAAPNQHGRLHLAGDDVVRGFRLLLDGIRIVDVLLAHVHVLVDVRAPGAQQRRVGLVDHDLRAPSGELPQGVRTAEVVDVAVGQQDPAHVLDPAADRLQCRDHAFGGRGRDPGVDDGGLGSVDEEAVESEPAPRRDQGMNSDWPRHCPAPAFRKSPASSKAR